MNQNPHWKQLIRNWAAIIFGNALYSLAVALFLEPAGLITGGATGIGFATGLEFARQGAHVAICGRSEAKLAKAREAFAAEGFELFTEALDVCDAEKLYAFGDHVIEKFGRLDVWMNNAGIAITKPLLEFTEEEWNRVLDLNLNAVFHGSQYAARKMIALGNGGVILNAGSFQALMPAAAAVPYGTTKAAVVMFSRTFAAEMAPYNIRVLSYIPGVISTPMAIDWLNETDQIRNIPSYRYGQPEDLANALVFVSSDRASYINGVHIDVTGGKFCVQNPRYAFEHMDKSK